MRLRFYFAPVCGRLAAPAALPAPRSKRSPRACRLFFAPQSAAPAPLFAAIAIRAESRADLPNACVYTDARANRATHARRRLKTWSWAGAPASIVRNASADLSRGDYILDDVSSETSRETYVGLLLRDYYLRANVCSSRFSRRYRASDRLEQVRFRSARLFPHLSSLRHHQSAEQYRRGDGVSQNYSRQRGNRDRNLREQARDGHPCRSPPRTRGRETDNADVARRRRARHESQLDASTVRRRFDRRLRVGARCDRQQGARDHGADNDARAEAQPRAAPPRRRDDGES